MIIHKCMIYSNKPEDHIRFDVDDMGSKAAILGSVVKLFESVSAPFSRVDASAVDPRRAIRFAGPEGRGTLAVQSRAANDSVAGRVRDENPTRTWFGALPGVRAGAFWYPKTEKNCNRMQAG